jgi:hypothetical protein
MPGLRRPPPTKLVLELTQALAEDYDTVPLALVSRVVQDAVKTTTGPDGQLVAKPEGVAAVIAVIEYLAREDLDQIRTETGNAHTATPSPTVPTPPATRPSGPRRGAA